MADETSPEVGQDEIESLLREAQQQGSASNPEAALATGNAAATESDLDLAQPPSRPTDTSTTDTRDIDLLLAQAEQAIASVDQPNESPDDAIPYQLQSLAGAPANGEHATLELIQDVDLDVRVELGRSMMRLDEVLQLKRGAVVPLDRLAGDPVDIFVNGRLIARGEILVLNDNFCIRVGELVSGNKQD